MELNEPSAKYLVQAGYKQTEHGFIPVDWCIQGLGAVAECYGGLTYSPRDVRPYGNLVLRSSNIQGGRLAFDDCVFVDMELPPRVITKKNDLLVCVRNGSRNLIGKCALIDESTAGSAFGAFMAVLRSESSIFLRHVFQSEQVKRQINERMGATINQITNRDMAEFEVVWPSDADERTQIGRTLSDFEMLIESLEQLLAKKRQIKQGAMQELLTCQRRLPGFTGDWVSGVLGDALGELVAGVSVNSEGHGATEGVPSVLKTSAIYDGQFNPSECKAITKADVTRAQTTPRKNSLLVSRMNTPDLVGEVGYVDADYPLLFLPDRVWMAQVKHGCHVNMRWLVSLLSSAHYKQCIRDAATGTSGSMKNISKSALRSLPVQFPSGDEQAAIASVLSDMDTEITALEARLTKARQLKQGMAQALLTGRIRLV